MNDLQQRKFPLVSRLLHWLMASMVLAMLFLGVGMASWRRSLRR